MSQKEKLLFIYTNLSPFVQGDLDILKSHYQVTAFRFNLNRPHQLIIHFIYQFFWLLFRIWSFSKIYIWFGDYHSFLPVFFAHLTKKKSFLVIGGYDVCRIKSLGYGSFKNPVRGFMTRFSMNHCTLNLCVSEYIKRKMHFIAPKAQSILLYNGVSLALPTESFSKENTVMTIGKINSQKRILVKGIDIFVETASLLPDTRFIIVGCTEGLLQKKYHTLPSNLTVYPYIAHEKLIELYRKAKVYCQFSVIESFCLTLAEAMLYDCVPVVSNVGAITEITGGLGFIVNKKHKEEIVESIQKALKTPDSDSYRKRIEQYFLFTTRQKTLLQIITVR